MITDSGQLVLRSQNVSTDGKENGTDYFYPTGSDSFDPPSVDTIENSFEISVVQFLSKEISGIPGVEAIYVRQDPDFLRVWIVILKPEDSVEDPIYATYLRQLKKLQTFPIDLSVLFRENRSLASLAPSDSQLVFGG